LIPKINFVRSRNNKPISKDYRNDETKEIKAIKAIDSKNLKQLYHLLIRIPGRSNPFDISQRHGLPEMIVQSARQLVAQDSQDLNEMIADLRSEERRVGKECRYRRAREDEKEKRKVVKRVSDE